jgi:rubrerythrin
MGFQFTVEDVFNVLIALEKSGSVLYMHLSDTAQDLETMKLFKHLSEQELQHQALYESWKSERFETVELEMEYTEYLSALVKETFRVLESAHSDTIDYANGLQLAKSLEKDTLIFLSECDRLLGGKKQSLIEKIKNEERKHLKLLYELG